MMLMMWALDAVANPSVPPRHPAPVPPGPRVHHLGYFSDQPIRIQWTAGPSLPPPRRGSLRDARGRIVARAKFGPPRLDPRARVAVSEVQFDGVKPGTYTVRIGKVRQALIVSNAPYASTVTTMLRSYYLQRCGVEIDDAVTGLAHAPCHVNDGVVEDSTIQTGTQVASHGGWHDAGDFGKYVAPLAHTLARLLTLHERNPTLAGDGTLRIPESDNGRSDLVDEVWVGLDWLMTAQREDGAVYRKLSGQQWPGMASPDTDTQPRYLFGVSTPETAKFAGVLALAARVLGPSDPKRATRCLNAAQRAWQWLDAQPDQTIDRGPHDDKGSGGYLASDIDREAALRTDQDDRLYAAIQLALASGRSDWDEAIRQRLPTDGSLRVTLAEWKDLSSLALVDLVRHAPERLQDVVPSVRQALIARAREALARAEASPHHLANHRLVWGSNKMTAEEGHLLLMGHELTQDARFLEAARWQADWAFGLNPLDRTFVTGIGPRSVAHVSHHWARTLPDGTTIPGLVVGGPNEGAQANVAAENWGVRSYADVAQSYATNENAIDYNAALIALVVELSRALGPS
ncbi:MAG: glycoside hydrolase family 9 protein [Myxococcota bacterium]